VKVVNGDRRHDPVTASRWYLKIDAQVLWGREAQDGIFSPAVSVRELRLEDRPMHALVVGGTGPTGLFLVNGLLQRGYEVSLFHRGTHELDGMPDEVEHIHGDPHFLSSIEACLKGRTFELVIATYGRIRFLARVLKKRTGRFIAISGAPVYRGYLEPTHNTPFGLPVPVGEDEAVVDDPELHRFSYLIAKTEKEVLSAGLQGHFQATCLRYPQLYGPHQVNPLEWGVMRRIIDHRPHIILPDGGLTLETRGYVENMAHGVLLAVDNPEICSGKVYNLGDDRQLTLRQWVESITHIMGYEWEIVSMPEVLARPGLPLLPFQGPSSHRLMDIRRIQRELGYRDRVCVTEALRRTVSWYLENPPECGGEVENRLIDPFDYEREDKMVKLYKKYISAIKTQVPFELPETFHAYAHPKERGRKRDHRNR